MRFSSWIAAALGATLVAAAPSPKQNKLYTRMEDDINYTVFEHAETGASLKFVKNSGICETTPGVNQYSGYLSVGSNMNMFFWFFEARHNPSTAPIATWLNGGPGCSSMIGLFQENGPCHFANGASKPSLNPYSWNEFANMLYVDQPIGTGFSYGNDQATGTVAAAPFVWKLLQAFFTQFPQYKSRDYGLFTESYGGHYGPEFAYYFEQQNSAIDSGSVQGQKINLVALGVNNGWIDATIQEKAYITYAANNTYNKLISQSDASDLMDSYNSDCLPYLKKCTAISGSQNQACSDATDACYQAIEGPISQAKDFDVYDVREPSNDPYPPKAYSSYLQQPSVQKAIGAKQQYQECPEGPYDKFSATGDNARSFLSTLSKVVQSGIRVVMWAGDADYICNYVGNYDVANALQWKSASTFSSKSVAPYKVNGKETGLFKTVDNLSWLQVYKAGHEVPYYQPDTALQVFKQTMSKQPLSST